MIDGIHGLIEFRYTYIKYSVYIYNTLVYIYIYVCVLQITHHRRTKITLTICCSLRLLLKICSADLVSLLGHAIEVIDSHSAGSQQIPTRVLLDFEIVSRHDKSLA